ncbi:MAG: response regulator transcription factor [Cyclobacteriaceae bacterium]
MTKIKITIADDHSLFRKGLISMFKDMQDIRVIGEAGNGKELLKTIKQKPPDLILLDLKMPLMDGVEVTEYVKKHYPDIKIVVLTMYDNQKFIIHLVELGVNGYLLKNADPEEMENTILTVMKDGFCFNNYVVSVMRNTILNQGKIKPSFEAEVDFTKKELQILKMICLQHTNAEIAKKLHRSARTIEGYRKQILGKIGAKNTAGMVLYAVKHGLIESKQWNEDYLHAP